MLFFDEIKIMRQFRPKFAGNSIPKWANFLGFQFDRSELKQKFQNIISKYPQPIGECQRRPLTRTPVGIPSTVIDPSWDLVRRLKLAHSLVLDLKKKFKKLYFFPRITESVARGV